jgi:phenylalanyl-tRNA synthetase beta chain
LETVKQTLEKVLPGNEYTDEKVGTIGVLHPSVLASFGIDYPCSALEFNLHPFL